MMSTSLRRVHYTNAEYLALEDAGWTVVTVGPGGALRLASVPAEIAVDDVYREGLEDAG